MLDDRMNALTAQITKMTPQQRQQFASMHKDDPIIIGMAKYINDQEKSLRNALSGGKNAQALAPQPTIVDQEISGMAALPAPNINPPPGGITGQNSLPATIPQGPPQGPPQGMPMQHYAGGGKTGNYHPLDDMDRYLQQGRNAIYGSFPSLYDKGPGTTTQPVIPNAPTPITDEQMTRALNIANEHSIAATGQPLSEKDTQMLIDQFKRSNPTVQQPTPLPPGPPESGSTGGSWGGFGGFGPPKNGPKPLPDTPQLPAPQAPQQAAPQPDPYAEITKEIEALKEAGGSGVAGVRTGGGGGGGGGIAALPASGGVGVGAPTQTGPTDIGALYKQQMAAQQAEPMPGEKAIGELNASDIKYAEANRDRVKADQEAAGLSGLAAEKRLAERSARLDKRENQNTGLAFLDAGLAMMAGKSQYAMQNIGEGALVGSKAYRQGQVAIDEGRDKVADAMDRLDELRRNETRYNQKEMREAEAGIHAATSSGIARIIDGQQKKYGMDRQTATALVGDSLKEVQNIRDNATRERDTQTTANAHIQGSQISANGHVQAAGIHAAASGKGANMQLGLEKLRLQTLIAGQKSAEAQSRAQGTVSNQMITEAALALAKTRPDLQAGTPEYAAALNLMLQNDLRAGRSGMQIPQAPTVPSVIGDPKQWSVTPSR